MGQTVYIYKCSNSTVKVEGKVNSIVLGELGEGGRGGEEREERGGEERGGEERGREREGRICEHKSTCSTLRLWGVVV